MHHGELVGDDYLIERMESAGGMGTVYRARERRTNNPVAIKVLRYGDQASVARFVREAALLAKLHHPGIVRYLANGRTSAGQPFLAMEWLQGETLSKRLKHGKLGLEETLLLGLHVAEALAAAHAQGIVHRDIKPSNLFLVDGAALRVKLLDFGIARPRLPLRELTETGAAIGTPGYMAPEQARGDRIIDARADVFALGCVLFRCLTGRAAFEGEGALATAVKVVLENVPRVSALGVEVPEALDELIASMLAKAALDRPENASVVARTLRTLATTGPASRPPPSTKRPVLTQGEMRHVSILLIDPRGHDRSSDADDANTAVDGMLVQLRAAIGETEARVEPMLDGTIAISLPGIGAATDQAARAAWCALRLRAVLPEASMALATGRALVQEPVPVGDAIDRAARRLAASTSFERVRSSILPIRIDEVTAGLLDARFEVRGEGEELVLCARHEHEQIRTLLGQPTPFVGREAELGLLEALFSQCVAESVARALLVVGSAGIGKSRLRYEFMRGFSTRGVLAELWLARGDPVSAGSAFGLAAQLVRRMAGVLEGEPLALRQQKLRDRLSRQLEGDDLVRVSEFLGELIGTPFPDQGRVQLGAARRDPVLMGDQIRRAWVDFLSAECSAQPVVIVLEDLHWGDLPSVTLIDAALRQLGEKPLFVLGLARPEVSDRFPSLWADREIQTLRVGALTRKASERLVRSVLGPAASAETVGRLIEHAAGNAFYLEELIRAAAEGRSESLPETVLAMVGARIDGMEVEAKRLLRAASVFGQVFWRGGAQALLGLAHAARTEEWLDELVRRELISVRAEGKFAGENEYGFRHALVREAVYATLTDADRELGHRLAAKWLESAGETEAMVLAEHLEQGGEPARAVSWYHRAAEQALEGNDLEATLARAERGIASCPDGELRGRLRLLQAEAHKWRGEIAECESCASEALEHLTRHGSLWCSAAGEAASASGRLGNHERSVAIVEMLCAFEAERDALRDQVIALTRAAMQLFAAGNYGVANRCLDRIDELAGPAVKSDPVAQARIHQAHWVRATFTGDACAALRLLQETVTSFEHLGDLRNACMQRMNLAYVSIELGAFSEAERALRTVIEGAERLGMPYISTVAKQNLGHALACQGALKEAEQLEVEALRTFVAQGDRRMEGGTRMYLSMILARSGQLDAAEREVRTAIDLLDVAPPLRAHALAILARTKLAQGFAAEALEAADSAISLLESLGGIEEGESLARLVHAEALESVGDHDAARAAITLARERLWTRAAKIAELPRRELFLSAVPDNARTLELARAWVGEATGETHRA